MYRFVWKSQVNPFVSFVQRIWLLKFEADLVTPPKGTPLYSWLAMTQTKLHNKRVFDFRSGNILATRQLNVK